MTVGPQPDPCNLPSWQRCPSCGAPLVNRTYTLCDPCAGHDVFAEIDAAPTEPFLKPQPSALAAVWARVCKTIGGMW